MAVLGAFVGLATTPAEAQTFAYVANQRSNNVSVIDTATNSVVATVDVGNGPKGVAVSPDGSRAWVANSDSGTVSVIDTASNSVIFTVGVGEGPQGVAFGPDGSRAYVANLDSGNVSVIDIATRRMVAVVDVLGAPYGVAITPDGSRAYVANGGNVSVIDTTVTFPGVIATVDVGSGPEGVAFTPDGSRAYVTNVDSDNVSVIDTATRRVVATVDVGEEPFAVRVTPDGSRAYVANLDSHSVSVIDTAANRVVATVDVGVGPEGVAITPDGVHAYVANAGSHDVSVIDTATNSVVDTVTVGETPAAVAILPGHQEDEFAYVANTGLADPPISRIGHTVSVIDTTTNRVVATITVGEAPFGVAATPTRAYVTNSGSNTVSVIDTAKRRVVATVRVGGFPAGVAVTPDGTRVYVTNRNSGNVSVIDTATNSVLHTIGVGGVDSFPEGVAVAPDGSRAYVTNTGGTVLVIDTANNRVVDTVTVGVFPIGVAITPDGARAYVAGTTGPSVSVIDTATNKVVANININGGSPRGVAITPDGARVYVTNYDSDTVSVIDTATNTVVATVTVKENPYGVAVTPDGTRAYVANSDDNTVSVIDTASNAVVGTTIQVGVQPQGVAIVALGIGPPVTTPRGEIAGTTGPRGDHCWPPQTLTVLTNGAYTLQWQDDGNLVLYHGSLVAANAVWATDTNGRGTSLCWQSDGNLVVYGAGSAVLFASNTADAERGGRGGEELELYPDGTLDIVNISGAVIWYGYRPTSQTTVADATVYSRDPNLNDGAGTRLTLVGAQPRPGRKRAVVAFDPAKIDAFLDAGPLASARLTLTSADQPRAGRGHWVTALPLRAGFVEGNGNAAEHDRGTGSGVTWNCAEDADINDFGKECAQAWPRPRVGSRGAVVFQEDGHVGPVGWDVTADVERGASAWLLAGRHGRGRSLSYHSREGAEQLADHSLAPTLILTHADENDLLSEAAFDAGDGPEAGAD